MKQNTKRRMVWLLCVWMLLPSLFCTGCFRMMAEIDGWVNKSTPTELTSLANEPPRRFFSGSKLNLSIVESDFLAPLFIFTIWELPLEVAADVLMLPVDLAIYSYYLAKPPLGLLIEKNRNNWLAFMLKQGVDPNQIDYRYHDNGTPLSLAIKYRNSEAAKLLLAHGAKCTTDDCGFFYPTTDTERQKVTLAILQSGIPKEIGQKNETKYYVRNWIEEWICKEERKKDEEVISKEMMFEIISLLLQNGFPVNKTGFDPHTFHTGKTILDVVLDNRRIPLESQRKMVSLLRSHNAKTFAEVAKEHSDWPHLDLHGIDIDPQFQPVVDILERTRDAAGFRVSDKFEGMEGPVLVFDYLPPTAARKGEPYTKPLHYHRRISEREWDQNCETMEIPRHHRIVLTPKGRKVPSQIPDGCPPAMFFHELWTTLDSCEMYVEAAFPSQVNGWLYTHVSKGLWEYEDLEAILLTTIPRGTSKYAARSLYDKNVNMHIPPEYYFFNFLPGKLETSPSLQAEAVLQRANRKTAELHLPGRWYLLHPSSNEECLVLVYSSMRTLEELRNAPRPVAPFPKETIVNIDVIFKSHPYEQSFLTYPHNNDVGYWNRRHYQLRHKKDPTGPYLSDDYGAAILHGDDVSEETLAALKLVLDEIFQVKPMTKENKHLK
ncbi:MAG: hypothetical protein IJJ26_08175 [Victivallales bacterium]|nr:hypothetical protein [Victivallales bacterium]